MCFTGQMTQPMSKHWRK